MNDEKRSEAAKQKISRVEVYWTTVTYRTVALYVALIFGIVLATLYLVFPERFGAELVRFSDALNKRAASSSTSNVGQARFVNLDGKVQVKKVDSVRWVNADYQMTLDKGDLIQTGPDGLGRLTFPDGTTYTVKADTLVTVEENQVAQDRASRVGMHIQSGAVDLSTGSWEVPGSKAEVSFENAVATLRENSRATARTDPVAKTNEITVAEGGAELNRGGEKMEIGQWEKASFPTGGPVSRSHVLAPPEPTQPMNLQPIIVADPKSTPVRFEWKPVSEAVTYRLRVSSTSMFAQTLAERRTSGTSATVTGLSPGNYFWDVTAIDSQGHMSEAGDPQQFTLAAQGKGQEMLIEVDGTELHGSVVEVIGRTEPGAALIINGQQVADIQRDGRFRYFTPPMGRGSQTIVITGQNRRGGTAIKRVPILIP
jgi:hypothetical protein